MTHTFQPSHPDATFVGISSLVSFINERALSRTEAIEVTGLKNDEIEMMVDGRYRQLPAYRVSSALRRCAAFMNPRMAYKYVG